MLETGYLVRCLMGTAAEVGHLSSRRHQDIAKGDLDELHADHLAALRDSREVHERRYDQEYITDLLKRLETASKSLREFGAYGCCRW